MCALKSWFEVGFRDVATRISQFWIPVRGKCIQEGPIMRLLMPEQQKDSQVDEPTSPKIWR